MQGVGGVGLKRRSLLLPVIALAVVVADQLVKVAVRASLPVGEPTPLIPHVLWLTHVRNTGGAFSILAGNRWLFVLASSSVVVALVLMWLFTAIPRIQAIGMGLVAGGAAGNLIDRVRVGQVTDYLDAGWFPVFNIADIAIVVGVCILGAWILLGPGEASDDAEGGSEGAAVEGHGDASCEAGDAGHPREGS